MTARPVTWEYSGPLRLFGVRSEALAFSRQTRAVLRLDPGAGWVVSVAQRRVRMARQVLYVWVVGTRRRVVTGWGDR